VPSSTTRPASRTATWSAPVTVESHATRAHRHEREAVRRPAGGAMTHPFASWHDRKGDHGVATEVPACVRGPPGRRSQAAGLVGLLPVIARAGWNGGGPTTFMVPVTSAASLTRSKST
jgi:hypothetical protein